MHLVITEADLANAPIDLLLLVTVELGERTELQTATGTYTGHDILREAYSKLPVVYYKHTGDDVLAPECYDFVAKLNEIDVNLLGYYSMSDTAVGDAWGLKTLEGDWITDPALAASYLAGIKQYYLDKTSATAWDKIKNIKEAAGRALRTLQEERKLPATKATIASRRAICDACPSRTTAKLGDACSRCGCYIKAKTKLAIESCPLGRWKAEA